jgi:hypothetical protein
LTVIKPRICACAKLRFRIEWHELAEAVADESGSLTRWDVVDDDDVAAAVPLVEEETPEAGCRPVQRRVQHEDGRQLVDDGSRQESLTDSAKYSSYPNSHCIARRRANVAAPSLGGHNPKCGELALRRTHLLPTLACVGAPDRPHRDRFPDAVSSFEPGNGDGRG